MNHVSSNIVNRIKVDTKSPESAMEEVLLVLDAVDLIVSEFP
jgi:hypothetical protein